MWCDCSASSSRRAARSDEAPDTRERSPRRREVREASAASADGRERCATVCRGPVSWAAALGRATTAGRVFPRGTACASSVSVMRTSRLWCALLALTACGATEAEPPAGESDAAPHPDAAKHDSGTGDASKVTVDARASQDAGLPDGSCRTPSDCPAGAASNDLCYGPLSPAQLCLGHAPSPLCTSNSQCDAGTVCSAPGSEFSTENFEDGGTYCFPPCSSDEQCNYWQTCTSGQCIALPCDKCPSYLSCSNGACGPKPCASDTECPGGYCVHTFSGAASNGTCFGALGSCGGECG